MHNTGFWQVTKNMIDLASTHKEFLGINYILEIMYIEHFIMKNKISSGSKLWEKLLIGDIT